MWCIKKLCPNANLYTDEMDTQTASYIRDINIIQEKLDRKYDVILCSHVLEHLLNPIGTIEWAFNHLKEGGGLYIEVPNSLNFVEPHLTFWSKESMLFYLR